MCAKKFQNKYRVESARLPGWDYSWDGLYFVTICSKNRECYFGNVVDRKMVLSKIGEMANKFWLEIPDHFDNVSLEIFQIMPNHVHGIIVIDNNLINQRNDFGLGNVNNKQNLVNRQSRYWDHIIRNEKSLNSIRQYIIDNPKNWRIDQNNQINIWM